MLILHSGANQYKCENKICFLDVRLNNNILSPTNRILSVKTGMSEWFQLLYENIFIVLYMKTLCFSNVINRDEKLAYRGREVQEPVWVLLVFTSMTSVHDSPNPRFNLTFHFFNTEKNKLLDLGL